MACAIVFIKISHLNLKKKKKKGTIHSDRTRMY